MGREINRLAKEIATKPQSAEPFAGFSLGGLPTQESLICVSTGYLLEADLPVGLSQRQSPFSTIGTVT